MSTLALRDRSGSRLRTAGLCFGMFVLLYGTSFYTRDWRSLVSHSGQPAVEQASVRSKVAAHSAETKLTEAPVWVEPEVTGSLPKNAEPVAGAPAKETVTPPLASAPSQSRAQPAALPLSHVQSAPPRLRLQHKSNKPTQVAAAPAARTPSPSSVEPSPPSTPIQFQLAERGN